LLPTVRGWLAIVLFLVLAATGAVRGVYSFLSVQDSVPGGVLVTEGWAPDYALAEGLAEFRQHHYEGIFSTGSPMDEGGVLSEYKTYADLSAAILIRLGADPQTVHAVPSPAVAQDRTYASALALRDSLRAHGVAMEKVNVVSVGTHSRRTRLLYEKAFGPSTRVGIIAVPHRDFEPERWWRSSQGFRIVTGELIAYFYARFLFHPA
jgi:hypothetical protein